MARTAKRQPRVNVPRNLRGRTRHFAVYVDPSLGDDGLKDADGVLARCEADYRRISGYFGRLTPGPFNVVLFKNKDGAYHSSCRATDLYCDAQVKPANGDYSELQNVMEFVEVFEAVLDKGWECGKSNGEGLSRVLAAEIYPQALKLGFATAQDWLNSSRKNYVDHNQPTDTSYVINGCSVLFLNWLRYQLKYSWPRIVAAGGPSLGYTYTNLTGKADGFNRFKALIDSHFPPGRTSKLATDNPFPL